MWKRVAGPEKNTTLFTNSFPNQSGEGQPVPPQSAFGQRGGSVQRLAGGATAGQKPFLEREGYLPVGKSGKPTQKERKTHAKALFCKPRKDFVGACGLTNPPEAGVQAGVSYKYGGRWGFKGLEELQGQKHQPVCGGALVQRALPTPVARVCPGKAGKRN